MWGASFVVKDAVPIVDEVCASMPPKQTDGMSWIRRIGKDSHGEDVNLVMAMALHGDCSHITTDLCKNAYHAIISGHASCPSKMGRAMGGVGITHCAEFRLTAGTAAGFGPGVGADEDWKYV